MRHVSKPTAIGTLLLCLTLLAGCASIIQEGGERETRRDKTKKGAVIGAAAGALLGAVLGEGEADEILAGAALGAGLGAGVGAYMDRQEEKLAQIPGTTPSLLNQAPGCAFRERCASAGEACGEEPAISSPLPDRKVRCHYPHLESAS